MLKDSRILAPDGEVEKQRGSSYHFSSTRYAVGQVIED
jgi:hypothetical protein